jgi:hypothetical protein
MKTEKEVLGSGPSVQYLNNRSHEQNLSFAYNEAELLRIISLKIGPLLKRHRFLGGNGVVTVVSLPLLCCESPNRIMEGYRTGLLYIFYC